MSNLCSFSKIKIKKNKIASLSFFLYKNPKPVSNYLDLKILHVIFNLPHIWDVGEGGSCITNNGRFSHQVKEGQTLACWLKTKTEHWAWELSPVIPAPRVLKQVNSCETEVSLGCRVEPWSEIKTRQTQSKHNWTEQFFLNLWLQVGVAMVRRCAFAFSMRIMS